MKLRTMALATMLVAIATAGWAQLSMEKADWGRGPVQYLMTPEEKTAWNAVKSDAQADHFVALFWARRDPTPTTPQNEVRDEFGRRVQYADKNFHGRERGSISDRGKVLILFGPPTRPVVRSGGNTQPFGQTNTAGTENPADDSNAVRQTWTYDGPTAEKLFGVAHAEFQFVDRLNNNDFKLEHSTIDFSAAQRHIAEASITQPNLTEPPNYNQKPAAQQAAAPPPAPAAPVTELKTPALETAITDARAGKLAAKGASIAHAEFVSPTGDAYVSTALFVPPSAGLTADAADTFFGVVDDATGKRVLAFEEPAKLTDSKGDFVADRTLAVPAGKYTLTYGLAKAGAPLLAATESLDVEALTKESLGTSPLLLSNNIIERAEAAPIMTPYAFGKLEIVPKADLTFTNQDELDYFVELHNPGIDPATNLPKIQMKMELVDGKGKTLAGAPLADVQALPLSGQPGPGQYAILSGIPLAQMSKPLAAGEYTLKMKLVDTVSKQSTNLEQKFRIVK